MRQATFIRVSGALVGIAAFAGLAAAQQPIRFAGSDCGRPPVMHCPDKDCPADRVANQGSVVEMKTRRTYFLDYPCDLKPGEKVTFVLSLHGGGSNGNWQRHYFPIMDYVDKYRVVVATPNSPTRGMPNSIHVVEALGIDSTAWKRQRSRQRQSKSPQADAPL